jgi:hypothetical protein
MRNLLLTRQAALRLKPSMKTEEPTPQNVIASSSIIPGRCELSTGSWFVADESCSGERITLTVYSQMVLKNERVTVRWSHLENY